MGCDDILAENRRRNDAVNAPFNPYTGLGSVGKRKRVEIADFPIPVQWLPLTMLDEPLVKKILRAKTINGFVDHLLDNETSDLQRRESAVLMVIEEFVKLRCRHDFPFWAATYVYVKNKKLDGDPEVLFRLSVPQRRFVEEFEKCRLAGKPIRIVLLKARQWGGSTTSQLYMAWLQLCHRKGLNSLIIAHQGAGSDEIKDMFDRMIKAYPLSMLHKLGDVYPPGEPKMVGVGKSGSIYRVPQRNCKIKIGTAERPDSCRGGDYALVHLSEVGIWKETDGKKPADIVRSACGGVLYRPLTMIVYESTPNGVGNFFHNEYKNARDNPGSQFKALFIPWYWIDWNIIPFDSDKQKADFAEALYRNRHNRSSATDRAEPGCYLWYLWEKGATLEAINWYVMERSKHSSHGSMASECPTDDIEAFVNSGAAVFDKYHVEAFRSGCRKPRMVGEVCADADSGVKSLRNLRFNEDSQGLLWVWSPPDNESSAERVKDRYLTVVDVGGRSDKADWSVILVLDRLYMMDGEGPEVAAQWYGHTDMDLLVHKAAQIAAYYDNSLLVIESNTIETRDRERMTEGDQSSYMLNQLRDIYPNLYARKQSAEDIRNRAPVKYGFHTNVSTKPMIISNLVKVIRERLYTERDERCLNEYETYERKQNGSYGAVPGEHDDLLMTRAIGLHICYNEMDLPRVVKRHDHKSSLRDRPVTEATL